MELKIKKLNKITKINEISKSFDFLNNEPEIYSNKDIKVRYIQSKKYDQ